MLSGCTDPIDVVHHAQTQEVKDCLAHLRFLGSDVLNININARASVSAILPLSTLAAHLGFLKSVLIIIIIDNHLSVAPARDQLWHAVRI